MHLSKKEKFVSQFFSAFLKSRVNFEQFQNKDDHHSLWISEIADCEMSG